MKHPSHRLLCLVVFFVMHFSLADGAELKSGIYRLEKKLNSATLQLLRDERHDITKHDESEMDYPIDYSQHLYTPLIDASFQAKYVVIVQDRSDPSIPRYKAVLLNRAQPEYFKYVTYSDGIARKYTELSFAIEVVSEVESWYQYRTEMKGFYEPFTGRKKFEDPQESPVTMDGKACEYRPGHEYHTFYTDKDRFFWKSHYFRKFYEPIQYIPAAPFFSGQLRTGQFYKTEQQLAVFALFREQPYIDILPIQAPVAFHTATASLTLTPGDFLAIRAEEDEWYRGDYITPDGEVISGSIFTDDLLPVPGGHAKRTVHNLTFDIRYTAGTDEYGTDNYQEIQRIKIYDGAGKLVQVLKHPGMITDKEQLLDTVDVNFDGFADLEIFSHDGGAGPNYGNNYYIFNPHTGLFDFNVQLSDLSQPSISSEKKLIYSAYRAGAGIHGQETYAWINGELTLVEFYETNYLDDDNVSVTHNVLVDGEMKSETKTIKASELEGK